MLVDERGRFATALRRIPPPASTRLATDLAAAA
jgi:hypothetical protein